MSLSAGPLDFGETLKDETHENVIVITQNKAKSKLFNLIWLVLLRL